MIVGSLVSCKDGQRSKNFNTIQNEDAQPIETTKNGRLKGVWTVHKLDIPKCKGDNGFDIELNKLLNDEVEMNDTFEFKNDSLFFRSMGIQKLEERYVYKDSSLMLEGSDWIYDKITVSEYTDDFISLAVLQNNICPTSDERYLIIKLERLKK